MPDCPRGSRVRLSPVGLRDMDDRRIGFQCAGTVVSVSHDKLTRRVLWDGRKSMVVHPVGELEEVAEQAEIVAGAER